MTTQWRIYCIEPSDEGWQYAWSDTPITTCPNNILHPVRPNSIQEYNSLTELLRIRVNQQGNTTTYKRMICFQYNPAVNNNIATKAKAITYKSGNMTSFNLQIFDITNQNELLNILITNEIQEIVIDLGELSNVPTTSSIIEISCKRNGGNNKSIFFLDEIVLF